MISLSCRLQLPLHFSLLLETITNVKYFLPRSNDRMAVDVTASH